MRLTCKQINIINLFASCSLLSTSNAQDDVLFPKGYTWCIIVLKIIEHL